MNHEEAHDSGTPHTLSEAQRAHAFATRPPVDRAAALRAGRTPVSPKFILWAIVSFVVLGLGGTIVEHFFGNMGLPTTNTSVSKLPKTPVTPRGGPLPSSLDSFLGLKSIGNVAAPTFTLLDQANKSWSLSGAQGKVVVLAFYNADCSDICPVVGREIKQAQALLGANTSKVEFVIVNTNPNDYRVASAPLALSEPHLTNDPSIHFLTGPLAQLNTVWTNYGISIRVGAKANQMAHNNIMYFINSKGELHSQVLPFANENRSGVYSLSTSDMDRFASGIAQIAGSLVK